MRFTSHNDVVVAVACGGVSLTMPLPLPTISEGEFSVLKDGVVVMTGRIIGAAAANGRITTGACTREGLLGDSDGWAATRGA